MIPIRRSTFKDRGLVRLPSFDVRALSIGHGHSFADPPTDLLVHTRPDGTIKRLLALDYNESRISQIWPPYRKVGQLHGRRYMIATAISDAEVREARALLNRIHHQGAAPHGLLISLYELGIRGDRALIGAAQIGEYYHTRPCGRDAFACNIIGPDFRNLTRGQEIKAASIVAAKRFAIAAQRQGGGLGQLLGRHTLKVARNFRWPSAGVVEVIRYQPETTFFAMCRRRQHDFLTRSGYVPVPPQAWLRNGQIDAHIAALSTSRSVAGYYYADLTNAERPEFIDAALAQTG